jgi:penicillin amidase
MRRGWYLPEREDRTMRRRPVLVLISAVLVCLGADSGPGARSNAPKVERLSVPGLIKPVEILRDRWGVAHIYAANQPDLFFAQGFNVARDRLFQLELWRRQATGTLAEILGPRAVERDIGARLLQARVDRRAELSHYHPEGEEIITSFVRGINAYIDLALKEPRLLPLEFRLLGIEPGRWTAEVVVSRHNGLFRNASSEIALAGAVAALGAEKVRDLMDLRPGKPDLTLHPEVEAAFLSNELLKLYTESRSQMNFQKEDIVDPRLPPPAIPWGHPADPADDPPPRRLLDRGSNNWTVSGRRTRSGAPILANDPHRAQQIPSLRYWVHLNAPGWDVIGGGEPALPGVSIGHNPYGAWGLTIFAVDQEDIYVYETDPGNPHRYQYAGEWEAMRVIRESIPIKGRDPVQVDLKYTRHGPVLYEDTARHKAYALRAAWLEVGCAPYLASLRMDQARSWDEFREACSFSRTPSENMVWADREGNIGWQVVGIAPVRDGWDGLLPVPGDGRFEWKGFLPIKSLPNIFNPQEGYFSSANEENIPAGYPHALGYIWAEPFRQARIQEVLGSGRKFTMADMADLQHDVLSIPARTLVPLLKGLRSGREDVRAALEMLEAWDLRMTVESAAAAVYQSWQRRLAEKVWRLTLPDYELRQLPVRSLSKVISWLTAPDGRFGPDPVRGRDKVLLDALEDALADIGERLGPDRAKWQYGQERFHHILIRHPLSGAAGGELGRTLGVGFRARPGNGETVNQTSGGFNQTSGASFRFLADLSDWDGSLGMNSPGQSGDPASPHYRDLFELWGEGRYFPVLFSRARVESAAEAKTVLVPVPFDSPRK